MVDNHTKLLYYSIIKEVRRSTNLYLNIDFERQGSTKLSCEIYTRVPMISKNAKAIAFLDSAFSHLYSGHMPKSLLKALNVFDENFHEPQSIEHVRIEKHVVAILCIDNDKLIICKNFWDLTHNQKNKFDIANEKQFNNSIKFLEQMIFESHKTACEMKPEFRHLINNELPPDGKNYCCKKIIDAS